jgi:hypothetical protein
MQLPWFGAASGRHTEITASIEKPSIDFDDYADSMGMRNSAAAPRAFARRRPNKNRP